MLWADTSYCHSNGGGRSFWLFLSLHGRHFIQNFCLPLNDFLFDVIVYFKCNFALINPFAAAHLTSFAVACKAYGGEATLNLLRSLCIVGHARHWLKFQNRVRLDIPRFFLPSMTNLSDWKFRFIFIKNSFFMERLGLLTIFSMALEPTVSLCLTLNRSLKMRSSGRGSIVILY